MKYNYYCQCIGCRKGNNCNKKVYGYNILDKIRREEMKKELKNE